MGQVRQRPIEWAQPVIGAGLKNFNKVSETVYRSEQPDDDAFAALAKFGIKEVLNLREFHSDDDEAKGLILKLHRLTFATGSITQRQIVQALQIIKDAQGPLLVHCWHGSDRTGAVVASYRIVFQGWTKEQALDELKNGGFGYHAKIYPNIVDLIKSLDVARIRNELKL